MQSDTVRNVLLHINDLSAHGTFDTLAELSNVTFKLFPPNTTSKIQHLDVGIIAAVKAQYLRQRYDRAVDMEDSTERNI